MMSSSQDDIAPSQNTPATPAEASPATLEETSPVDATTDAAAPATSPEPTHDSFYKHGPGLAALDEPTPFGDENALQKLGKPPFERSARSKFRLVGYLATVYEHVTEDVGGKQEAAPKADAAEDIEEVPGEDTGEI